MKCENCGKKLDKVDSHSKFCTFCGTFLEETVINRLNQ